MVEVSRQVNGAGRPGAGEESAAALHGRRAAVTISWVLAWNRCEVYRSRACFRSLPLALHLYVPFFCFTHMVSLGSAARAVVAKANVVNTASNFISLTLLTGRTHFKSGWACSFSIIFHNKIAPPPLSVKGVPCFVSSLELSCCLPLILWATMPWCRAASSATTSAWV